MILLFDPTGHALRYAAEVQGPGQVFYQLRSDGHVVLTFAPSNAVDSNLLRRT